MKSYTVTVNGVTYDVTVEENVNGAVASAPRREPVMQAAAPKAAPRPVTTGPTAFFALLVCTGSR